MRNSVICFVTAACLTLISPALLAQPSAFGGSNAVPPPPAVHVPTDKPIEDLEPVKTGFEGLELKGRICQLMMVTMQGQIGPSSEDLAYLKDYTPGAVMLQYMIKPEQAAEYVNQIRGTAAKAGIPLLVGADLYVLGTPEPQAISGFAQIPSLLSVAAAEDADATARLAKVIAAQIRAMGFDFHFGPTLELAPTLPGAPGSLQNFGSNPIFAAEAACTILDAFSTAGVLAVPTGFPGGGRNRTGREPAVLLTPEPQLAENDLYPYMQALQHDVKMLHVGNTLVPTLDTMSRAASQSKAVLTGLLREKLGFEGVVLAGPLDAEDIAKQQDPAEAALAALQNGADMLYWRGAEAAMMRVVDYLVLAVEDGRLSETIVNAALSRVRAMKETVAQNERKAAVEKDFKRLNRQMDLHREAYAVERRALTIIKNDGQVLPLHKNTSLPLGITGIAGVEELYEALHPELKNIVQQRIATAARLGDVQTFEIDRITKNVEGAKTIVCVLSDTVRAQGQVQLVRDLKKKGVRVVVIFLGYPRDVQELAAADAILLAYCDSSRCAETMRAAADLLLGYAPVRIFPSKEDLSFGVNEPRTFDALEVVQAPSGRLPVSISEAFPAGVSIPYDPNLSIENLEWDFGDGHREVVKSWAKRYKKIRKKSAKEREGAAKKQEAATTIDARQAFQAWQKELFAKQEARARKFVAEQLVVHEYAQTGRYPITLRITDTKGYKTSHVFYADVQAATPVQPQ